VKWFRKAADQGFAYAQGRLAAMYVNGQGVPQDYAEAVKWFRAADQGNADAQGKLAPAPPSPVPTAASEAPINNTSAGPSAKYSQCVLETIKDQEAAQRVAQEADREKFIHAFEGMPRGAFYRMMSLMPPPPSTVELEMMRRANFTHIKELCRIKFPCAEVEVVSRDYNTCLNK
jgi:TPR repeat protein